MRVAIALLVALSGCLTAEEVDTSETDQGIYIPITCAAHYVYAARGRSTVWRYIYSDCHTTAWTTWETSSADSYPVLTDSAGGHTWTSAPACNYYGWQVQRGDVTCWPSDTHWMAKCSTSGVLSWEHRTSQYCIKPGSGNASSVISRPGAPVWANTPNISLNTNYSPDTNNPSPVAAALDQSRAWGAECRATSECPPTGICAGYTLYDASHTINYGTYAAKCRDRNELYNQQQSTSYYYDTTYYDRYGDNLEGGTW